MQGNTGTITSQNIKQEMHLFVHDVGQKLNCNTQPHEYTGRQWHCNLTEHQATRHALLFGDVYRSSIVPLIIITLGSMQDSNVAQPHKTSSKTCTSLS
jgi:hypothetical protein